MESGLPVRYAIEVEWWRVILMGLVVAVIAGLAVRAAFSGHSPSRSHSVANLPAILSDRH